MAKKTIISDFSALKGRLTFSEKTVPARSDSKEATNNRPCKTERIIQVGQDVVLMDSEIRGRIISLGKTVEIELQDGLIIKAAYGEFAVTHAQEISLLRQSKVKAKKTSFPARPDMSAGSPNRLIIDLHIEAICGGRNIPQGQQLQFQMEIFRKVIRENLHHRGMTITFIHGIGDGILKAAIRKELDEVLALRCSYSVGDPATTMVSIK